MTETSPPANGSPPDRSAVVLGAVLIGGGLLLLAGQVLDFDIAALGWPTIVIGVGVVLLVIGLFVSAEQGMVVGGTVVTTVGLVLLYQDQTGRWESWAYAWALVGPAASGLGLLLWGLRSDDRSETRNGAWAFLGGLGLFAIGFLFFEGIIGISGERLPIAEWVLPALVIGIGVVVLGRGLISRGEPDQP
jgi:dipeptide/tripeptide permease